MVSDQWPGSGWGGGGSVTGSKDVEDSMSIRSSLHGGTQGSGPVSPNVVGSLLRGGSQRSSGVSSTGGGRSRRKSSATSATASSETFDGAVSLLAFSHQCVRGCVEIGCTRSDVDRCNRIHFLTAHPFSPVISTCWVYFG